MARLGVRLAKAAGGAPVRLEDRDLRTLLLIGLERSPDGRQVLAITREARASVAGGRLELGLVVNLSAADEAELSAEQREILARLGGAVPFLRDRDLYLAVSGVPEAVGGDFSLARESRIKVSFLTLSVPGLAELLSLDVEEVRQALVIDLPVTVENVRVVEDAVLVEISG